jgi:hypothetical protein
MGVGLAVAFLILAPSEALALVIIAATLVVIGATTVWIGVGVQQQQMRVGVANTQALLDVQQAQLQAKPGS